VAIVVPIVADTSGLIRNLNKGSSSLRTFGKVAAITAGAAGIGALVATVRVGIGEFNEQQRVMAQTNAVLKSTQGAAKVTAKEITALSGALMKKTGIDDEAIQSGQNLLLTFTKVRNEVGRGNDIFDQATVLMTDLSVAMGKDLSSSALLVGKALNDPIKGVSALSRAGVQFTADQKEQIKTMVESGNVMGAQKMILKELETQFGGSADAAGKTLTGQLNILKQTFNNLAGELVATFMPTIARAATKVAQFLLDFSQAPTLKAKIEVITGAIGDVWGRIKTWWNTGEVKELPSGLSLTPPGKTQVQQAVNSMMSDIRAASKVGAENAGYAIASWILGGTKKGAKEGGAAAGASLLKNLVVNEQALRAGAQLVEYFIDGVEQAFSESKITFGSIISSWLSVPDDSPLRAAYNWGKDVVTSATNGAEKQAKSGARIDPFKGILTSGKKNALTDSVRQAVQDARRQLQGLGSSILGLVSSGRSQMGIGGGRAPGAILADERKLEDDRYALEEQRLRDAKDASDATEDDKLAYRELVLQRERTLRDRALADQEQTDKKSVDNLIEQFNRGEISAQTFQTKLNEYLGADFGTELGIAFSGAFKREFQGIINLANDIFTTVGGKQPIAADANTPVNDALKQSNQTRFEEALKDWQSDQDTLAKKRQQLKDKKITKKQLDDWIAANRPGRPKPQRADYGLALGGILNKQVFTAGEAGPEAVMPLTGRGGAMLRDALGMNEQRGATYNITVNAGMGTNGAEVGREIVEAIKVFERRNGPVFAGA
jgi:hypothetical protein